jgi:hypothetical protein
VKIRGGNGEAFIYPDAFAALTLFARFNVSKPIGGGAESVALPRVSIT